MEIDDLLEAWEVSQDTIQVFRENHIDVSCLDGLGEVELNILIPQSRLRDKIKFKMGFKKFKEEQEALTSNCGSLDTLSTSSLELFSDDTENSCSSGSKLNLQELLKQSMQGRQALVAITNNKLDSSSRCNLVQAIVEYYIKKYAKMTKFDFEAIATEVVRICPNECKETYYVPSRTLGPKNTMPAKGKLVDRYYNQLRNLRVSGVLPKKRKRSCPESNENESMENDSDGEMEWLKYNRDPWPLVETKWKASCAYRKNTTYNSNKTLATMVNEWLCLKTTNGHRLIEIDFEYLYPEKSSKLFEKWGTFQNKAIHLMKADSAIPNDMQDHLKEDNDNENVRDLTLCCAMAYKIKPTSKIMGANKKKMYKVSIAESSQSFLTQVKNYADIEEELVNRRKAYDKKGLTCQPIIISVGEVFYVCIDDIKYSFDSVLKAVDVCFKCFMVLNLSYPKECEQVWLFIQQYFYEIQLNCDKKFGQVSNFIKQLQE